MAVTRKIKSNDLDNAINNLLDNKETPATPTQPAQAGTPAGTKEEKIKITFFVNKSTKDLLQEYCKNNDMTLTAGIKKAIREMLSK